MYVDVDGYIYIYKNIYIYIYIYIISRIPHRQNVHVAGRDLCANRGLQVLLLLGDTIRSSSSKAKITIKKRRRRRRQRRRRRLIMVRTGTSTLQDGILVRSGFNPWRVGPSSSWRYQYQINVAVVVKTS